MGDRDQHAALERRFLLALNKPITTDGFDEVSPVAETTNLEMSPDGTFVMPRRGSAIYRTYQLPQPGERMRLMVESQPPNLSDGSELAMIVSSNGIEAMKLFKTRTNLPGDTFHSEVFFQPSSYTCNPGDTVTVTVKRTGALDRRVTATYATQDGTAIAGTDYTNTTGTVTFESGEASKDITISTISLIETFAKSFAVKLSNPSNGATIGSPSLATIIIGANTYTQLVRAAQSSIDSRVWSVMFWDQDSNELIGYFLRLETNGTHDVTFGQTDSGTVFAVQTPSGATGTVYCDTWSPATLTAALPAYINGSGSPSVTDPDGAALSFSVNAADVNGVSSFGACLTPGGKLYLFSSKIPDDTTPYFSIYGFDVQHRTVIGRATCAFGNDGDTEKIPTDTGNITTPFHEVSGFFYVGYTLPFSPPTNWYSKYMTISTGGGVQIVGGSIEYNAPPSSTIGLDILSDVMAGGGQAASHPYDGVQNIWMLSDGVMASSYDVGAGLHFDTGHGNGPPNTSDQPRAALSNGIVSSYYTPRDALYNYAGSGGNVQKTTSGGSHSVLGTGVNANAIMFSVMTPSGNLPTDGFKTFGTGGVTMPSTEVYSAQDYDSGFAGLFTASPQIIKSGQA